MANADLGAWNVRIKILLRGMKISKLTECAIFIFIIEWYYFCFKKANELKGLRLIFLRSKFSIYYYYYYSKLKKYKDISNNNNWCVIKITLLLKTANKVITKKVLGHGFKFLCVILWWWKLLKLINILLKVTGCSTNIIIYMILRDTFNASSSVLSTLWLASMLKNFCKNK